MKRLFLMRHGKAEDGYNKTDFERDLLPKGIKKSKKIARFLQEKNVKPDCILVSMSQRTIRTAQVVKDILLLNEDLIKEEKSLYLASSRAILDTIYAVDDTVQDLLIIGHNPGISGVASYLSHIDLDWMPTSAVVGLEFDLLHWNEIVEAPARLIFYTTTKDL